MPSPVVEEGAQRPSRNRRTGCPPVEEGASPPRWLRRARSARLETAGLAVRRRCQPNERVISILRSAPGSTISKAPGSSIARLSSGTASTFTSYAESARR
jgi:hypothetical protein